MAMTPEEAKKWLKSIIRQRMMLVKMNKSHLNRLMVTNICDRLTRQLSAFPYQGNSIFGFIRRHYTDILMIIPANRAEKHNCEILNKLSICEKEINTTPTKTTTQQPMQQLFSY
jgi:hypothetical protein